MEPPLKVGMLVHVRSLEEAGSPVYGVRVQDVGETSLVVQRAIDRHRPVRFPNGSRVEISVTVEDRPGKEGRYRGECVVIRHVDGPVPLLRLSRPESWERVQLRQFFRVPVTLEAKMRRAPVDGDGDEDEEWMSVQVKDISGGGCQIVSSEPLQKDDRVELELTLNDEPMRVLASVARIVGAEPHHGRWYLGLEFVDIGERERQRIIQFAFQRQIELRKKGMA